MKPLCRNHTIPYICRSTSPTCQLVCRRCPNYTTQYYVADSSYGSDASCVEPRPNPCCPCRNRSPERRESCIGKIYPVVTRDTTPTKTKRPAKKKSEDSKSSSDKASETEVAEVVSERSTRILEEREEKSKSETTETLKTIQDKEQVSHIAETTKEASAFQQMHRLVEENEKIQKTIENPTKRTGKEHNAIPLSDSKGILRNSETETPKFHRKICLEIFDNEIKIIDQDRGQVYRTEPLHQTKSMKTLEKDNHPGNTSQLLKKECVDECQPFATRSKDKIKETPRKGLELKIPTNGNLNKEDVDCINSRIDWLIVNVNKLSEKIQNITNIQMDLSKINERLTLLEKKI